MNGERNKREQAQKLLRSLSDIDDRFLMEALEGIDLTKLQEVQPEEGSDADVSETAASTAEENGTEADREKVLSMDRAAGRRGRRIRRYSTWALTAAACLTVFLVGRYALLSQRAGQLSEKAEYTIQPQTDAAEVTDQAASAQVQEDAREERTPERQELYESAETPLQAEQEDADSLQSAEEDAASLQAAEEDEAFLQVAQEDAEEAAAPGEKAAGIILDADTLEAAGEIAGFDLQLPDAGSEETFRFRACAQELLEAVCLNKDDEELYRIRKGAGKQEDISGDYRSFEQEETIRLRDGTSVKLQGDAADAWADAVWFREDADTGETFSYALCAGKSTFTTRQIRELAEKIR